MNKRMGAEGDQPNRISISAWPRYPGDTNSLVLLLHKPTSFKGRRSTHSSAANPLSRQTVVWECVRLSGNERRCNPPPTNTHTYIEPPPHADSFQMKLQCYPACQRFNIRIFTYSQISFQLRNSSSLTQKLRQLKTLV